MGFKTAKRQSIVDFIVSRCSEYKQVLVSDIHFDLDISEDELRIILKRMVELKLIHRCTVVGAGEMMNNLIAAGPVPSLNEGNKELEPVQVVRKNWVRGEHKRNEFESFFFGGTNVQV